MISGDLVSAKFRDRLIATAAEPAAWDEALDQIGELTGATGAILFHRSVMPGTPVSRGVAEGMATYWRDDWLARDIRMRAIPTQLATGLATDEDCVGVEEMGRAALYNDFLARFGLQWFAGVGFKVAGQLWCLSIQRSPRQGMFEAYEKRILAQLSRVMTEVGTLTHLLAGARTTGLTAALDRFGDYWVTYDLSGRRIAESEAEPDRGSRAARLRALSRSEPVAGQLRRGLRALRQGDGLVRGCFEQVLVLSGTRLTVKGLRLTEIHAGFGRAQYLLTLTETRIATLPDPEALRRRFGLTIAEVQLALALGDGLSLRQAAEQRAIAYETARAQLKSIFGKLDIHRQSQLVAFLRSG